MVQLESEIGSNRTFAEFSAEMFIPSQLQCNGYGFCFLR